MLRKLSNFKLEHADECEVKVGAHSFGWKQNLLLNLI